MMTLLLMKVKLDHRKVKRSTIENTARRTKRAKMRRFQRRPSKRWSEKRWTSNANRSSRAYSTVTLTKTSLKENLLKSKSILCLPLRLPSTLNLLFIQMLNVTVAVWLQSLVQDTNALFAKTSTTALHAKKENPIHIHSSRSTSQDKHQLLSSPPLMRILQERLTSNAMLNKIQPSSEIKAQVVWDLKLLLELATDLDLNSSKTWSKTSPEVAGEAEDGEVDVDQAAALEEWWEADAHSEAKVKGLTEPMKDHNKMLGDWEEQRLSQFQEFLLVLQVKLWLRQLTFRTTLNSHTNQDASSRAYSQEELHKFSKMLLSQLTSKSLHSRFTVSTFLWRSRKALMSPPTLVKNITLPLSNSMDLEAELSEKNSTSSSESRRSLMKLTSTTRLWCSLKKSLKIFTLMTSHSRRSLRFSRRPKAMPISPKSSSRKWVKAPSSLLLANSSRWLFKTMMRKIFTHEFTSSKLLYFETYISITDRHGIWENVKSWPTNSKRTTDGVVT